MNGEGQESVKVRIAVGLGAAALGADVFAAIVTALKPLGFDSLWVSDVLSGPGPDPLVALATAAQLDPKLKLGTTLLLPGRNELRLAKSLASLDVLSRGRLLLVFVSGRAGGPEGDAVGVPVAERGAAFERTLPRLRAWWAGEQVDSIRLSPLPVQEPLECWMAGLAEATLRRCGRLADGWLGAGCSPEQAGAAKAIIDEAADRAGRVIDREHFGLSIAYSHRQPDDKQLAQLAVRNPDADPRQVMPVGHAAVHELLENYIAVGMSKFVVRPPVPDRPGEASAWLDELSALANALLDLQS
ncbi:MAG: LLM class flavin-dependent oxidoreductase [Actinobacteria bacterium]|nr:LLM class flavin-dependent oxidoreductase [Actinomycetota bacterium]